MDHHKRKDFILIVVLGILNFAHYIFVLPLIISGTMMNCIQQYIMIHQNYAFRHCDNRCVWIDRNIIYH